MAALAILSCQKENTFSSSEKKRVQLQADRPESLKTAIDANGTSLWLPTDAIGVISEKNGVSNDRFENTSSTSSETTSFVGETYVGGQVYAYYPYRAQSVSGHQLSGRIAAEQHPSLISYDGASDLLVARGVNISPDGNQLSDLCFCRLGAILKLSLIRYPSELQEQLVNERVQSVSLRYEAPLSGDILYDYTEAEISGWGETRSNSVTATYSEGVMGNSFDSYLVVAPGTLESGKALHLEIQTEHYIIRKEVTLSQNIPLYKGSGNVIKVDLSNAVFNPRVYIYFWAWSDPANAQEMTLSEENGIYEWVGACGTGEFKFMTAPGEYWSGWFRDENAANYWTMKKGGDQCMFKLADQSHKAGEWRIRVNTNDLSVQVAPKHLYLDFWAWGTAPHAKEFTETGFGTFTWTGYIPVWEFKLLTINDEDDDYWSGYFRDPDASYYWTLKPGNEEKMFKLEDRDWRDGTYTIEVNTQTLQMRVIPHIWLIGAFEWGWTRANAQEMSYVSDGVVSWTGKVYANATFKFLIADMQSDGDAPASGYGTYIRWYGYVRNPSSSDYWTVVWNDAADDQFDIAQKGYASGIHTITLNLTTKHVDVTPAQ